MTGITQFAVIPAGAGVAPFDLLKILDGRQGLLFRPCDGSGRVYGEQYFLYLPNRIPAHLQYP